MRKRYSDLYTREIKSNLKKRLKFLLALTLVVSNVVLATGEINVVNDNPTKDAVVIKTPEDMRNALDAFFKPKTVPKDDIAAESPPLDNLPIAEESVVIEEKLLVEEIVISGRKKDIDIDVVKEIEFIEKIASETPNEVNELKKIIDKNEKEKTFVIQRAQLKEGIKE